MLQSLAIAVAAFAALGVAAYFGQPPVREILRTADPIAAVPSAIGGPTSAVAAAGTSGLRATGMDASVTLSAAPAVEPIEPVLQPSPGRTLRNPPAPVPVRPAGNTVLSAAQSADAYEPVQEAPRPAPAPPAPVVVPPPPDRWQSMRDDMSRCEREGGFGGFVCDQRVRLASCEGFWGRVPQCPLPAENPGGQ